MTAAQILRFAADELTRFISPLPVAAEWALLLVTAAVLLNMPVIAFGTVTKFRDAFVRLSNRKTICILLCFLLPVVTRLVLLGISPVPEPSIHDEFSHLLLADTLAHGRLTNPPHPLWQHFETIHVIQQPTYNSMYPPAQGAALAFGKVFFHEPWAGVLIAAGIMFAAFCWALQGWLPAPWALYGSLIAIAKLGIESLWVNSYLPAAVPSIGGALVIGSLPRLRSGARGPLASIYFGVGAVILMESRPVEGAVLCLAGLVYLAPDFARDAATLTRRLLPAGMVLACGILFHGYYSYRVTGNALRMPYQVNRDTYGWPENLGFLPAKTITSRHKTLQDMYVKELRHREIYKSVRTFTDNLATRLYDNWTVLAGPLLTIPLLLFGWIFRDRRIRPLAIFLLLAMLLNLSQMVLYPYHLAAVIVALFAIVAAGMRRIRQASGMRGLYFALTLPFCLMAIDAMKHEADAMNMPLSYWERAAEPHGQARASVVSWLAARPARQLVIVEYGPNHSPDQEWVYNSADPDNSKIVWARGMGVRDDAELLKYFPDREVWLLKADEAPARVVPYSGK